MTVSVDHPGKCEPRFAPAEELDAVHVRLDLKKHRVLAVALVGPPGAGKTAILEATARQLKGKARVAVITINPAAERDAARVSRYCSRVQPVKSASPRALDVRRVLERIKLDEIDTLFIESLGGIEGAPELGQDATVTVLSVSGGDDKAAEYASLLSGSQALLLSKAELQRHVLFDRGAFRADVRHINPLAEFIEVSAFENKGLGRWLAWLDRRRQEKDPDYRPEPQKELPPEWFFG